jgi:hypothetical protein
VVRKLPGKLRFTVAALLLNMLVVAMVVPVVTLALPLARWLLLVKALTLMMAPLLM